MDVTQIVGAVVVWLWPLWKPGAEEFSKKVGNWLGGDFTDKLDVLFSKIGNGNRGVEQAKEQIPQLADTDPELIKDVAGMTKNVTKTLLWDTDRFVTADLTKLANTLEYDVDEFGGFQVGRVPWVDRFVNQAWADWKMSELIDAIRNQKPHLFE